MLSLWCCHCFPQLKHVFFSVFASSFHCDFIHFLFNGDVRWGLVLHFRFPRFRLPLAYLIVSANVSWSCSNFRLTLLDFKSHARRHFNVEHFLTFHPRCRLARADSTHIARLHTMHALLYITYHTYHTYFGWYTVTPLHFWGRGWVFLRKRNRKLFNFQEFIENSMDFYRGSKEKKTVCTGNKRSLVSHAIFSLLVEATVEVQSVHARLAAYRSHVLLQTRKLEVASFKS